MFIELTKEQEIEYEFECRCQNVASYLWVGRSVVMTAQQLRHYRVTPHQVIAQLANCVNAEEAEASWQARLLNNESRLQRMYVVYCTKQGDTYVFRAKVKS